MKITLIGPVYPYRGGIAHFTSMLARKLIEAGHDVQMISFKKQYPLWLYPGKSDKDYSEGRETIDANYLLTPFDPISWKKMVNEIRNFKPQKVIIPWWVTFWGPAFHHIISCLKKYGIPSTILIHNTLPHEAKVYDRFLARWTLQEAENFIVMTQKEKLRLTGLLPHIEYAGNKLEVVSHPIYRVFKPSGIEKGKLRSKFGLPAEQPVMLFFGFVRLYKGLDDLLEAHKILLARGLQIRLIIAGEFWEDIEKYKQKIDTLELSNFVMIFNKYIPDDEAAQYFEMSDIFVAPYRGGTQSGVLKAALGFGLPVVLTDVIIDEVTDHFPGLCKIVPPQSPMMLANGIEEQLNTPLLSNAEIDAVFSQTWEKMVKAISH
ncbi:MAG: glycosyltransferase [Brevefilum sp.]|nr:glycosyltransferase [Brevefilum sp.]